MHSDLYNTCTIGFDLIGFNKLITFINSQGQGQRITKGHMKFKGLCRAKVQNI